MKKVFSFLAIALMSTAIFAQTTWTSDDAHSKLAFAVTHLTISEVSGLFNDFDIAITATEKDFSDAVFDLSVAVASIDTEVKMRDDHLRSADFFDAQKFPEMTFKSSSIKETSKDRYELSGNLTMHGITKPVRLQVWYRGSIENAQANTTTAGFQITGTLKRSAFEVGTPSTVISDEVRIQADAEFVKKNNNNAKNE